MEYSNEELNYFRLCKIVTSVIPEGLREIFKQQWDTHYTSTGGPWMDTPANFASFQSMESPRNRKKNKRLLGIMKNGDRTSWDSTCLSYAILFSDSVGPRLQPNVKNSVNILRESRNEVAHNSVGQLNDRDFQASVHKILMAFITLKLDTTELLELAKQTSFPTGELNAIKKELEKPKPFCVLPPKSFHDQIKREHEVQDIAEIMKELSNRNKGETTAIYISGNPGCGKSVLAGQIGDQYYDSHETEGPAFVMTINVTNMGTLLQSYVDFAVRLNCSITEITTSKDLSQEKQILQLKALVAKKVEKYDSWLIIIDNVINLKACCKYWPQFGVKTSGVGQMLVTTQDEHCIPDNIHTQHVSLKRGMSEVDAIEVLSNISGIREDDERMLEVAKSLDLQPLALACAGVYMKKARTSTTWQQFLENLAQGKREASEKMFQERSLNYPMSMTVAVKMALERETSGSKVMFHAFEFLSVLANDPVPTENVVDYVMKCLKNENENEKDEGHVASTITSSSLVMTSDDRGEIFTHQIVHHCLLEYDQMKSINVDMFSVIATFSCLLEFFDKNAIEDILTSRSSLNHFERLSILLPSYIVLQQPKRQLYLNKNGETFINDLNTIGNICIIHGKFKIAKVFFQLSLSMQIPFFINEMENLCVGSEIVNFNLLRKRLDLILKKAISVFKDKKASCDHAELMQLNCYQEFRDEIGKRNIAETLSSLGKALSNLGEFSEAKDCHKVALEICELEHVFSFLWLKLKASILDNLVEISKEMQMKNDAKRYSQYSLIINEKIKKVAFYNEGLDLNAYGYIKASSYYGLGKSKYSLAGHSDDSYNIECVKEAIMHFEKALEKYQSVYKDGNHPKVAHTLNQLGRCAFRLQEYDQAKSYHEDALSIYKFVYTEDHPMVGSTLSNLGKTLFALDYFEEAATCFNKSLVINERLGEKHHPAVGELQRNLGLSLRKQGLFLEAKIHFNKAMAIFKIVYGETHRMVFRILLDIAEVHRDLHKYAEARMCYEDALAIGHSNDSPYITESLLDLGDSCYRERFYSEARRCYEYVISIGCDRSYIGPLLFNIGVMLLENEQLFDAKQCYMNGLKTRYGTNVHSVGESLFKLGTAFRVQRQLDEVKSLYNKALTTGFGKDCPSVGEEIFKLGTLLRHQGQLNEAKSYYDSALTTGYGKDCPSAGVEIFMLGIESRHQGQLNEAKSCYDSALTTGYGKDCPSVGEEISHLGLDFYLLRNFKESKECYMYALAFGYDIKNDDDKDNLEKLVFKGDVLFDLGFHDKAIKFYFNALASGYDEVCSKDTTSFFNLCDVLYNMDSLCEAQKSLESSFHYFQEEYSKYHASVGTTALFRLSKNLYESENYLAAKTAFDKAMSNGYEVNSPTALQLLGDIQYQLGKVNEAIESYKKALTLVDDKESLFFGESIFKLGTALCHLRHQAQLNEAKTCYDNALMTGYGKDCPSAGKAIFKLGTALRHQAQLNEAKSCYDSALTTGYGKDCPSVGEEIFKLGTALYREGHLNEASACYERALTTGYGKGCPFVGKQSLNLAHPF